MGFWSKLGGAALAATGVGLTVATGGAAAPAGAALIGAGMGVIGNDVKKEGAKKAAGQQEAAANKAIEGQRRAAEATTQAYAPYTQTGGAAMSALGSFMGLPATFGQTAGPPGAMARDTGIPFGSLPAGTQEELGVRAPAADAVPAAPAPVERHPGATRQTQAAQANTSSYSPTLGGIGGGLVRMQAPTGQVQWVSREQAPFYAARGAVEVA